MYYVLPTILEYERCISGFIYNKRIVSVYKSSSVQQSLYWVWVCCLWSNWSAYMTICGFFLLRIISYLCILNTLCEYWNLSESASLSIYINLVSEHNDLGRYVLVATRGQRSLESVHIYTWSSLRYPHYFVLLLETSLLSYSKRRTKCAQRSTRFHIGSLLLPMGDALAM